MSDPESETERDQKPETALTSDPKIVTKTVSAAANVEPWVPPGTTWARRFLASAFTVLAYFGVLYVLVTKVAMLSSVASGMAGAVLFFLGTYGLVTILVQSEIAQPFREALGRIPVIGPGIYEQTENEDHGLLSCPLCSGQWIGSLLPALGLQLFPIADGLLGVRDLFVHGLVGAAVCWLLHVVTEKLGASSY